VLRMAAAVAGSAGAAERGIESGDRRDPRGVAADLLYSVTSFWQQILRFLRQQEEALSHIGTRLPKGNLESLEPEEPASRGHARAGKPRVSSDCSDFQPLRRQFNSIDSTTTGGTELQHECHKIVAHACSEAER